MKPGDLVGFCEMGTVFRHIKNVPSFTSIDGIIITQIDVMTVLWHAVVEHDCCWLIVLCRDRIGYAWSGWVKRLA